MCLRNPPLPPLLPSLLPSLSFPFFFSFSLLSHHSHFLFLFVPFITSYTYPCSCIHTSTFHCCAMYVCPPLSGLIKGKGRVCLWEKGVVCMRRCFWATVEILCLFAIRSDRQHSHIHHYHLPLDTLSTFPFPLFYLSSCSPSLPASLFFPAPVK